MSKSYIWSSRLPLLAIVLLAISALACGIGGAAPTATLAPTNTPQPTATPQPTQAPTTAPTSDTGGGDVPAGPKGGAGSGSGGGGDVGALVVENQSDLTICYLYVSPTTSDTWGDDMLGASGTIAPGESFTVQVDPGTYDLRVDDCENNSLAERTGVDLTSGFTWTLVPEGAPTGGARLIVENTSSLTVCYIYISPDTATNWGEDWLGSGNVLGPGQTFTSNEFTPGVYDLRVDDCENNSLAERHNVEIQSEFTWTLTD